MMNENLLASLRAAHRYQHGGPPLPYSVIRILEKKGLIVVYRRINEWSDYLAPMTNNRLRTVRRPTIITVILLHDALEMLRNYYD